MAVAADPARFRAVAALGGGGTVKASDALKKLPVFVAAGELDIGLRGARALKASLEKAEVATLGERRLFAPRIGSQPSIGCAVGRPVPFRLGGEASAAPPAVGPRLGPAHVDRPVADRVERRLVEQGLLHPGTVPAPPHERVIHPVPLAPGPVLVPPEAALRVPARVHELPELAVAHGRGVDGERLHIHVQAAELVVPAEGQVVEILTEPNPPGRDGDLTWRRRAVPVEQGPLRGRHLQGRGKLLHHVQQRLVVHELVLEDDGQDAPLSHQHVAVRLRAILDLHGPVLRVTGYDVPYPYWQLEDWYMPSVERVTDAARRVLAF